MTCLHSLLIIINKKIHSADFAISFGETTKLWFHVIQRRKYTDMTYNGKTIIEIYRKINFQVSYTLIVDVLTKWL